VTPKDIVLEEFHTLVALCATPHTSHRPFAPLRGTVAPPALFLARPRMRRQSPLLYSDGRP
jgi:hypothetical protein